MKTLVVAEKPSVGRDIARVLKCVKKQNGYIEGNRYVVTWGLGHLVTLAAPENYDKKYKDWKMEDIPIMPQKFEIEVIKQTAKQYGVVKQLIHRKDIENIVIATDAGREGELVARWILKKAKNQKPCKRLWISSVTDKAIKEGFSKLKSAKEYENLYYAAVSRAEADWLVGLNATRALTCKYNAQLSCGRVQTPTLAMIAKRENEIKNFKSETYYGITAQVQGILFTWRDEKSGNYRSFSKERMEEILNRIKGDNIYIIKIDKKDKKSFAPLLYDLTELQREANKRFGYSAKETLNILQRLYENHKVLTYPRTDSKYITTDIIETFEERLRACAIGPYKKMAGILLKNQQIRGKKVFVNNSKVTDHHAIIPTEQCPDFMHMTIEEKKLYDLVVKRFLAVLYPPCEYEETVLTGVIGGEKFYAKGNVVIKTGWKEVYQSIEEDEKEDTKGLKEQKLPLIKEGQILKDVEVKLLEGQTKPPAKFNEATLLSAMENPIKYMESKDQQMAKTLGETGGLGTVATRADIIDKLFSGFFIEKKGEEISVTSKGRQLLDLVPEELKKPELTAKWEMNFSQIAKGELKSSVFMNEIKNYTVNIVEQIKYAEGNFKHDNLTNKICPQCGKRLLKVNGKNAKMLVCQDRNCGYKETISRLTNARCPVCHKKMEMVGNGEDGLFVCVCGHKERLAKFQERRKKEGAGVSKKDVKRYLSKQKDESINNAFADAFKRMNKE